MKKAIILSASLATLCLVACTDSAQQARYQNLQRWDRDLSEREERAAQVSRDLQNEYGASADRLNEPPPDYIGIGGALYDSYQWLKSL